MKLIIIGMGNTLLSDDGVGIVVAERLAEIFRGNDAVEVIPASWGGFRIIDLLSGYDEAIIIDAVKTEEVPAGSIRKFTPADIVHSLRMVSFHDINFATALEFARQLNIPMPEKISIYAIEVENITTISEELTLKVQAAVEICVQEILKEIKEKTRKACYAS
jgi:hydrogenase maturation protease